MDQSISKFFLKIQNATIIRGNKKVFSNFSHTFSHNKVHILNGANGSGKTTLLRTIAGLIRPITGQLAWNDESIKNKVNFVGHSNSLSTLLTVKVNLLNWLELFNLKDEINKMLSKFNIEHLMNKRVFELSSGEKRKVALSKLFVKQRNAWILDEPLESLDESSKILFCNLAAKHIENQGILIMSSNQNLIQIPEKKLNIINIS